MSNRINEKGIELLYNLAQINGEDDWDFNFYPEVGSSSTTFFSKYKRRGYILVAGLLEECASNIGNMWGLKEGTYKVLEVYNGKILLFRAEENLQRNLPPCWNIKSFTPGINIEYILSELTSLH